MIQWKSGEWLSLLTGGVLLLGAVLLVGSCASSSNNPHDDWVLMSEDVEKSLGSSSAQELEKQVGIYDSDTMVRYVDNVGSRVAVYSQRPDLDYQFGVLDIFQVNALALPGGYVYVTRGLMKELDTEAELAGVLAHEIAHVAAYHSVKRQQWSVLSMISAAAVATQTGGRGLGESLMAQQMLVRGYTRASEAEADRLGLRYTARAGYDPQGLVGFLQALQELHGEIPQRDILFMRTHPFLADRIRRAENDMDQYRELLNDTPIVGQARFQRHKRRYLFEPKEERFLETFNKYFEAYRSKDLAGMRDLTDTSFRLGDATSGDTVGDFMEELDRRVRSSRKVEYNKRLLKLDVGDTDAVVVYEYESRLWGYGDSSPTINDGLQEMVWRRRDGTWRLSRLR